MNLLNGTRQVFVCGAGHQGFAMAAHLSLNGLNISLWNRTPENIHIRGDFCAGGCGAAAV